MKTMFALAALFVTQSAFASVCNLDWNQIYKKGLSAQFHKVQFGSIFVPADEVCVDGQNLRTKYAVSVCVEYGRGESSDCAKYVKRNLVTPITFMKSIPVSEGSFEKVEMSYPLNYKVAVGRDSESFQVRCYKAYSTPSCQ